MIVINKLIPTIFISENPKLFLQTFSRLKWQFWLPFSTLPILFHPLSKRKKNYLWVKFFYFIFLRHNNISDILLCYGENGYISQFYMIFQILIFEKSQNFKYRILEKSCKIKSKIISPLEYDVQALTYGVGQARC